MKSFRQKILLSYLILLLLFLALMFPLVIDSVQQIVFHSMSDRADELIHKLQQANDDESLIKVLKEQKHLLFYRIGILDDKQRLLYDSHTRRIIGPLHFPMQFTPHTEVEQAIQKGIGYSEEYSQLLGQELIYLAKTFEFHKKNYVLRLAFPHQYIQELRKNFEIGFILFSSVILILFSVMTGLVLNRLTHPIRQIIQAIRRYQSGDGDVTTLPEIQLKTGPQDDFTHLANTLNSLSSRIKSQIETLTHERNEKEAILESLAEGVLAIDKDLKISYANSMALNFLQITKNELGQEFPSSKHPKCYELLLKCIVEGKVLNGSLEIIPDSKSLHLNIVASPREKGRGAILVLQDKSIYYKILEMRKDFIANASHELKTPITIIRGFAETLQEHPYLPKETIDDITFKIVKNCQRMTKIIKNLLTLADIENLPHSRLEKCSLIELVMNCKNTLHTIWPQTEISLHFDPQIGYELTADPELLEVAVMNLLDNAAKYSKEKTHITIQLEKLPGHVKVAIQDNGIGIPQNELENVFQRFYTVNKAHSKKLGGSGLGLSIVETIVEKHFGKISVESTPGIGSTFSLYFPDDIDLRLPETKLESSIAHGE
jgi:two-component system, OmpR family, phosphate regulon sensor histidine kinase PhoR